MPRIPNYSNLPAFKMPRLPYPKLPSIPGFGKLKIPKLPGPSGALEFQSPLPDLYTKVRDWAYSTDNKEIQTMPLPMLGGLIIKATAIVYVSKITPQDTVTIATGMQQLQDLGYTPIRVDYEQLYNDTDWLLSEAMQGREHL